MGARRRSPGVARGLPLDAPQERLRARAGVAVASGRPLVHDARSMVRLNKIYTKTGDDGTTGLGDGSRLPKHHVRIAAYGTVDELSSVIGLAVAYDPDAPTAARLRSIQNDLFDLGADLCVPGDAAAEGLRIRSGYVTRLEGWIDEGNAPLAPLNSFILPGGTPVAAWLHLARTVCRRAERLVTELAGRDDEAERVNPEVVRYLNRLSDLFFVLARVANDGGKADILWKPGESQPAGEDA